MFRSTVWSAKPSPASPAAIVLYQVLDGISAAQDAGLKIKINTVALKRDNAAELPRLVQWAHNGGMDITLIKIVKLTH